MHACPTTGQDPSFQNDAAITSKKQILLLESIHTAVNTRNTCITLSSKEKKLNFSFHLSGFCFVLKSIWQKFPVYYNSVILTLSQVRHCTELIIVPSNMSEITLRYFLCCFFLFGDDADWARIEKQV